MKKMLFPVFTLALLAAASALAEDKIPLKTELPPPLFVGTPVPINVPNLEPKLKAWPDFAVPVGTVNLAKGKKVTASDSEPVLLIAPFTVDRPLESS